MKIGIISLNIYTTMLNFASPLHSYAFQQFLSQHGIDSVIIDYKPNYYGNFNTRHPYFQYKKHPLQDSDLQKSLTHKWLRLFFARQRRFDKFKHFIDTHYVMTDTTYDHEMLDTTDLKFDCYICATDVIWKYNPDWGFEPGYFLACDSMKGKPKIAYAASRGPSEFDEAQQKRFLEYITPFDYISVREKSLGEYISSISNIKTTHVLDPVLLHEKEFYEPIIKRPNRKKKYVLIYIVMKNRQPLVSLAVNFAKKHNLDVIELSDFLENAHYPEGTHHKLVYGIGIEEWLGYMDEAEYIFTNSFHATCFSILFHKQFFVGKRRGDKISSVLEMFGLSGRTTKNSFRKQKCIAEEIDYAPIDALRRKYMKTSSDFLLSAISNIEHNIQMSDNDCDRKKED